MPTRARSLLALALLGLGGCDGVETPPRVQNRYRAIVVTADLDRTTVFAFDPALVERGVIRFDVRTGDGTAAEPVWRVDCGGKTDLGHVRYGETPDGCVQVEIGDPLRAHVPYTVAATFGDPLAPPDTWTTASEPFELSGPPPSPVVVRAGGGGVEFSWPTSLSNQFGGLGALFVGEVQPGGGVQGRWYTSCVPPVAVSQVRYGEAAAGCGSGVAYELTPQAPHRVVVLFGTQEDGVVYETDFVP